MTLRICLAMMVAVCTWPLTPAAQGASATVSGCVSDSTAAVLPGVRVLLTKAGTTTEAVTDSSGCYQAGSLAPGTYMALACLVGFETAGRDGIAVTPGRSLVLDFQLKVGGICECIHIPTLQDLWKAADAVIRVRLTGQRLGPNAEDGAAAIHTATILTAWKFDSRMSGHMVTFRQPLDAECQPYRIGRELVLFLRWNDQLDAFERVNRENGAFTIEKGRITWAGVDEYYGQTTDAFLAAVEATKQRAGQ